MDLIPSVLDPPFHNLSQHLKRINVMVEKVEEQLNFMDMIIADR